MPTVHAPCGACGADQPQPAYTVRDLIWGDPTPWTFVHCGACGHGYIDPQPDGPALGALYQGLYTPEKLGQMVQIGRSGFDVGLQKARAKAITAAMTGRTVRKILDIGCGVGFSLQRLAQAFPQAEALGVETAPPAAEKAAELPEIKVLRQDFEELDLPAASVDVLCMNHVLEHIPQPRTALARAAELVAPGGVIEVEVPRLDGWARRLLGRWWWCHLPPQHLQLFHQRGLEQALAAAGFDPFSVQKTGYPGNFTVGLVLMLRYTVGSASPYASNWLVRGPAMLAGLLALPLALAGDALLGPLLNVFSGDILRIVARRSEAP